MAGKRTRRAPLTRDRILRTALELADEDGLETLSMRRLGHALGVEAMSLYNHVANKDDVIDGILDLVLAESEPATPDGDWHAAVRRSAVSVFAALRRHPWAAALVLSPAHLRPGRLRHMDALLARLREAGFSAETTYHACHVIDAHTFGFSIWHASHAYNAEEATALYGSTDWAVALDDLPDLRAHVEQHSAEGPHREASAFEIGLDLILDGLERTRDAV
jgi:AcrR family transcriptional regulator